MKLLVYGATGPQGRPVARKLLTAGHEVRLFTRDSTGVQGLEGAEVVQGDMADARSLEAASRDREGVFLHIPFFTLSPLDGLTYAENALRAASGAGVRLLVWNSSGKIPPQRSGNPAFDIRLDILDAIIASGIPYVVLQPTAYMENFLGPWTREKIVQNDTFAYPTPDTVRMQWFATEDVGSFKTYAFAYPELAPLNLDLGGPERLSGEEVAERFSRTLGRDIAFRAMLAEEFGAKLEAVFPGMGEGATQGGALAYKEPERFSSHVDLAATLQKMPVVLTTLEAWVHKHREAFR